MKLTEQDILENKLTRLCNHYDIPEDSRPMLEFFQESDKYMGRYDNIHNEIYILEGLSLSKAILTLRHEFGHFLMEMQHPKHKYKKSEEITCNMMERTLLRFNHPIDGKQKSLDNWIKQH